MLAEDPAEAERLFDQGAAADLESWPFIRANLQLAHGTWLRRQRRTGDARDPLRAARDAFDAARRPHHGAIEHARSCAPPARPAPGRRARRSTSSHPQELEIAQLAATGPDQPRDRPAALPLPSHRRLAPLPPFPQARHHVATRARRRAGTRAGDWWLTDRCARSGCSTIRRCALDHLADHAAVVLATGVVGALAVSTHRSTRDQFSRQSLTSVGSPWGARSPATTCVSTTPSRAGRSSPWPGRSSGPTPTTRSTRARLGRRPEPGPTVAAVLDPSLCG